MSMPQFLEPVDMLHGKEELRLQSELRFLISWPPNLEITLDYSRGPVKSQGFLKGETCVKEELALGSWNMRKTWPAVVGLDGWKGHVPRTVGNF